MFSKLLYKLTSGLPCRLITVNDRPYLERYFVGQAFGVTVYLHRFVSSDRERHLHNHPWKRGASVVLCGAYDEEIVADICPHTETGCIVETRRVRWFNRVDANRFHRIANAKPGTWTLFMHGPRQRLATGQLKGWGFLERLRPAPLRGVTVFREYISTGPLEWWHTAPKGRDAGRVAE